MLRSRLARALAPAAASFGAWGLSQREHCSRRGLSASFTQCEAPKRSISITNRESSASSSEKAMTFSDLTSFETYIFDCDGVIWGITEDDTATSVATVNYLLQLGKRVMFVTNNSNKTRAQFVSTLESKGVDFGRRSLQEKVSMMVSASYTTAVYLRERELRRPFIITSDTGVLEECRLAGITEYYATITDDGKTAPEFQSLSMLKAPDVICGHPVVDSVVVGWDMELTANKVATAINYIKWHEELHGGKPGYQALPLIACSGDAGGVLGRRKFGGSEMKIRAIGNGAMADIIGRSFDPAIDWIDMGKPSDALLSLLRDPRAYNVDLSKTLMVGDTLQTDIVFGNRGGMQTLLVLTGVTTRAELEAEALSDSPVRRPTYVLTKLGTFVDTGDIPRLRKL